MRDIFVACLAALLVWSTFKYAAGRVALWYMARRLTPAAVAAIAAVVDSHEQRATVRHLADEQAYRDGWHAALACRRLHPEPDDEHIMHHYSWDGTDREKEKCRESA